MWELGLAKWASLQQPTLTFTFESHPTFHQWTRVEKVDFSSVTRIFMLINIDTDKFSTLFFFFFFFFFTSPNYTALSPRQHTEHSLSFTRNASTFKRSLNCIRVTFPNQFIVSIVISRQNNPTLIIDVVGPLARVHSGTEAWSVSRRISVYLYSKIRSLRTGIWKKKKKVSTPTHA